MNSSQQQIIGFIKSFKFAKRGIIFCLKNERNMRVHTVVAILIIAFSFIYGLTSVEYAILFITVCFTISAEMLNTAIEALVDLQTSAYADLARIAKDVAAGAVFISAISAIASGLALFLHFPKLINVIILIATTPYYIISFVVAIAFGILFIFKGFELFRIGNKKS